MSFIIRTDHADLFRLLGGSSKVDILIATPGRLIDHINHTPNFSLQHLRFLVTISFLEPSPLANFSRSLTRRTACSISHSITGSPRSYNTLDHLHGLLSSHPISGTCHGIMSRRSGWWPSALLILIANLPWSPSLWCVCSPDTSDNADNV